MASLNESSSIVLWCLLGDVIGAIHIFLALSFVINYHLLNGDLGVTLMVRIFLGVLQKERGEDRPKVVIRRLILMSVLTEVFISYFLYKLLPIKFHILLSLLIHAA